MERNWDMYDYILESKDAVRNIVEKQENQERANRGYQLLLGNAGTCAC